MKTLPTLKWTLALALIVGLGCVGAMFSSNQATPVDSVRTTTHLISDEDISTADRIPTQFISAATAHDDVMVDPQITLCQGYDMVSSACGCQGPCNGSCGAVMPMAQAVNYQQSMGYDGFGYGMQQEPGGRTMLGIDDSTRRLQGFEPRFRRADQVPFEQFGYGGYIGPHRTPHVAEYRIRVNDLLEFVYIRTREKSLYPYQLYVGDIIDTTGTAPELNHENLVIRSDGKTSFKQIGEVMCAGKTVADLQRELNDRYREKFVRNPDLVVQVRQGETPLQDIINSVDARQGQGGQTRQARVTPDGTIQLPAIGNVPAIGLTLNEIAREVNARYRLRLGGIEVTPTIIQNAPRFVYVLGEVGQPGRVDLTGPTTAMQAIAMAQGFNAGGNIRQIIVFRRDQNWRLTATKLDLAGALYGKRGQPSDEIWLQDSDIILIPKKPIQRLSEAVNLYMTNTLYAIFPQQGVAFNFDNFTSL